MVSTSLEIVQEKPKLLAGKKGGGDGPYSVQGNEVNDVGGFQTAAYTGGKHWSGRTTLKERGICVPRSKPIGAQGQVKRQTNSRITVRLQRTHMRRRGRRGGEESSWDIGVDKTWTEKTSSGLMCIGSAEAIVQGSWWGKHTGECGTVKATGGQEK